MAGIAAGMAKSNGSLLHGMLTASREQGYEVSVGVKVLQSPDFGAESEKGNSNCRHILLLCSFRL